MSSPGSGLHQHPPLRGQIRRSAPAWAPLIPSLELRGSYLGFAQPMQFTSMTLPVANLLAFSHVRSAPAIPPSFAIVPQNGYPRHPLISVFSRMRSEGFPFRLWGSGGWTLVRIVCSARRGRVAGGSLILWLLGAAIQRVSSMRVYGRFAWQAQGIVRGR